MQRTFFGRAKSIAGAALVGLGVFVLYGNLEQATTQLKQLGTISGQALGVLPTLILAACDQPRFLHDLLQRTVVLSWPLLLVMLGTLLSRDTFADNVNALPQKDAGLVDLTAGRSTLK